VGLAKQYYQLTKPGIIYGNLLTAIAGYLLGSRWHIDYQVLAGLLAGVSLVIASACVCNNCLDRGIDSKMQRTRQRALVSGVISVPQALLYAAVLGVIGLAALASYTNVLTVSIGLIAFVDYVVLYGWSKRHSVHGTLVGSISGSAPIVAGYTAATGRFDTGAVLLFLILTAWQMPHFYAISLYRYKDYRAAGLPVLPIAKSRRQAKLQTMAYIVAYTIAVVLLTVFGYTGYIYALVMAGLGVAWFWRGWSGWRRYDSAIWGRRMFLFSLIVVVSISVMTAVGGLLP
jgi:protoheme IX farnesyltransferase